MARRSGPDLIRATRTAWVSVNGQRILVREGDLASPDDPIVSVDPTLFGPLRVRFPGNPAVEQATAAPGERRQRSLS